ncbi:hypothetical protein F4677DRAFT_402922 [Hypoxylon crocopeplum]|nr:hypothetical protein F4677DRAFT_402922 [Hypoxylon crocopeplum]
MPYSDNMYSFGGDSESDGENYADHLSPTDGYFASSSLSSHVVPHVPNILVPDPTLQQQTLEADGKSKAQEAEEERVPSNSRRTEDYYHNHYPPIGSGSTREPSQLQQRAASSTTPRQPQYNSALAHTYSPSSSSSTPFRTYPARGRTPSLYSEAPPAYSPSPTTPLSPPNQSTQPRSYNTFNSNMGLSDTIENERLLGGDPESIGQPSDEEVGSTPQSQWGRRVRRRLPTWLSLKMLLFGLIILVISIGFLANSFRVHKEDDHKKTIGAQPIEQEPPDSEKEPVTEPGPDDPTMANPFLPSYCEDAHYRYEDQILDLNFDRDHNITFVQELETHSGGSTYVHVGGQVRVRRLGSGGQPRLVLEIGTTDRNILLNVITNEEAQSMKVIVPKKSDSSEPQPCVVMMATIWVPEDAEIGMLNLGVVHLDVLLMSDLSIHVADYTKIASVVGDIRSGAEGTLIDKNSSTVPTGPASPFVPAYTFVPANNSYVLDSRVLEISSTSGRIDGNWPLYDMLGLHTVSGDIKASITPKDELKSYPKPAVLSVSSVSGAVHATEPIHAPAQIPLRNYLVDVKSTSGGIHGALAFGAGVQLKSTSSNIALDLLPVMDAGRLSPQSPAQLETATTSGTTAVRVLEPLWFGSTTGSSMGSKPLNCLMAAHRSTSGDIGLRYPQAWEGYLQAETTSGRLGVRGRDVKIIKSGGGWVGSKIAAQKGPGGSGSTIQVHALTGDMDAVIGKE